MDHDDVKLLSAALCEIAKTIRDLGTGNAATPMGALEYLASEVHDQGKAIALALHHVAEAIEGHNCP